jgi:hypothetical protein
MKMIKKIIYSILLFLFVSFSMSLTYIKFYNRTPFKITLGIILGVVLYCYLLKFLIIDWDKKK